MPLLRVLEGFAKTGTEEEVESRAPAARHDIELTARRSASSPASSRIRPASATGASLSAPRQAEEITAADVRPPRCAT